MARNIRAALRAVATIFNWDNLHTSSQNGDIIEIMKMAFRRNIEHDKPCATRKVKRILTVMYSYVDSIYDYVTVNYDNW